LINVIKSYYNFKQIDLTLNLDPEFKPNLVHTPTLRLLEKDKQYQIGHFA